MVALNVRLTGFDKQRKAQVAARARQLGLTTDDYIKRLVEEDLAISHEAKTTTFAQLLGPGRDVDEREVDRIVDAAKARYRRRASKR